MPSPIRLAFVAALAALALGACSGGGGGSGFFPIKSGPEQVTRGYIPAAGSTLETIVTEETAQQGFPQFSVFEFGAATNANGIPLQKATKTEAGRYAAVAYQAVLEHSMFLFQGGIYYNQQFPDGRLWPGTLRLSTGTPSTGSPVAGTWEGRAVALEHDGFGAGRTNPRTIDLDQAESLIVQGDVEIGVTLDGGGQNVTWAFRDWEGGSIEYPDVTSEGTRVYTEEDIEALLGDFPGLSEREIANIRESLTSDDHYRVYHDPEGGLSGTGWSDRTVGIQFYGPGRQEAGGTFTFEWEGERYILFGAFAAKKQP